MGNSNHLLKDFFENFRENQARKVFDKFDKGYYFFNN
jgi:hypothetical protein